MFAILYLVTLAHLPPHLTIFHSTNIRVHPHLPNPTMIPHRFVTFNSDNERAFFGKEYNGPTEDHNCDSDCDSDCGIVFEACL